MKYLKLINYIAKKVKNYKNRKNNINSKKFLKIKLANIQNINGLIEFHFNTYSENDHINKEMFRLILNYFSGSSLNILETGSAAHGTKSSLLFASYIKLYGGKFDTVDTNPDIKKFYNFLESRNIRFHSEDSLTYIKNLDNRVIENLDLIYLDSYDLNLDNPSPSQEHGLNEFLLLNKKIKKGAIISIDDTPISFDKFSLDKKNKFNFIPGKGRLVLDYLKEKPNLYETIYHDYSLVLRKL